MARRRYNRRSSGKADGGSSWISYSDMMAALLLLFVLFLCYSVYQYFLMLETKTAELNEQSTVLTSQQATLNQQELTLSEQQALLDDQRNRLAQQEADLAAKEASLIEKEAELADARAQVESQKQLLETQALTMETQQKMIIAGEQALASKQTELEAANAALAAREQELNEATIRLDQQQIAMDQQQQKLDDLVGVRTKIVEELIAALQAANLTASVDPNTGDIVLESNVFFDVGKSEIKPEGRAFLQKFIPVYLGVLLQDEYSGYIGEIIIEGHTDTQGDYLSNLRLSQERALSVVTFCLQMPGLTASQREALPGILTAKGRSFSDPILNADGTVNMDASRRVEFKFRMKDSEMIEEIRSILSSDDE